MGIPVIVDLPVGDNLQDHITSGLSFVLNDSVSYDLLKASTPYAILDYYLFKKNELTSNLIEGTIFVKTKYENQSDDWPDIQLVMIPGIDKEITQFILFMLIYALLLNFANVLLLIKKLNTNSQTKIVSFEFELKKIYALLITHKFCK
jgi:hypothetical protein